MSHPGTNASPRRRFCLVTSAHVSNNPRLVKEADALTAAGYDVRVVGLRMRAEAALRDDTVTRGRPWRFEGIDVGRETATGRWLVWSLAQAAARGAFHRGVRVGAIRDLALSRFAVPLALAAARERADSYIAHNVEALPAAAWAARRHDAQLAFDIEDLHEGVLHDDAASAPERERIVAVQRRYLARCDRLTAASDGIGEEIAARYGVARPISILNSFPASERPLQPQPWRDRVSSEPSLYWFSQTLGPDRGIEDAIDAMPMLGLPVRLYLRGEVAPEYERRIRARAEQLGVAECVHLLPLVAPGELMARAAEHDVGLALEMPITLNRDICVTNKLLLYLAAGLPVVATATRGQRALLAAHPVAARLYPPGDAAALAACLRSLLVVPGALDAAKSAAVAAAAGPFAWEREAARLVAVHSGGPIVAPIAEPDAQVAVA